MVWALLSFTLKRRLKMLSTWVYAVVLFASGLFLMLATGGMFQNISASAGVDKVMANSPYTVFSSISSVALFGLLMVGAVFGQAAHEDFGTGTWMIIFTRNVKKQPYLLGRFLGAFVFSCVLFLAIAAGQLVGAAAVWLKDPAQLTAHSTAAYLWPYLTQVWPMLFFAGALFFALAAFTRRMAPVYVGMVVLVLGYLVLSTISADVQNRSLASVLDPFGFLSFELVTRYWTPVERNRDLVPLTGLFLVNRLLWTAVGAVVLGAAIARFRTTVDEHGGKAPKETEAAPATVAIPRVEPKPTTASWVFSALSGAWLEFRDVLRSPVYWSFIVAGIAMVLLILTVSKQLFGTPTWPVTWQVLELAGGGFGLFSIITITFYAGELVWKERDAQLGDIVDATRVPTWVGYTSKLLALLLVALSLEGVVAVAALVAQLSVGYTDIDWKLYVTELLVQGFTRDVQLCVLALFAQIVINHKYLGHGFMVLYYIANIALREGLGVEERLLRYGAAPGAQWSDMNGYGHFLGPWAWYRGYWLAFAFLLVLLGGVLVVRGRETSMKARRAAMLARLSRSWRAAFGVTALVFLALGGSIFHSTHIKNPYVTSADVEERTANYEKSFKSWATVPHPRIVAADVAFDIYPAEERLEAKGHYSLTNKTQEPVTKVLVNLDEAAKVNALEIEPGGTGTKADEFGTWTFTIDPPLAPGASANIQFDLTFAPKGLTHRGQRDDVVENGTFFNNFSLPILGYQESAELSNDSLRKKFGLAPKERMADRDDEQALENNYIRKDSDFIDFTTTVSTSADQVPVAPGYLDKEWEENGRKYARFTMDQPILNFFSVLSARYEVKRDEWNGVKLEIYYQPGHTFNLDAMMQGMKDALAYCSEAFGPYQHKQARILEFPRYKLFAQSFPNTIPYSEGVGFIARVRPDEPDDIDYPYYVTAHEIAHQWWAHQVVGGNVQGCTMTSETMAQYSALMVMKKRFGADKMKRFLKYELDKYLMGRAMERKKEVPLSRVENQPYIHYQKGSLVMYALQDFIGEATVNRAMKEYVQAVKFQGPPYTNSTQLLRYLKAETPPEYLYLYEDLFETITLYDNRTESATMKPAAGGGWDVTMKVVATKYRSDDSGKQSDPLEFDDWMEIGALDDKGRALHLEKRQVKNGPSEITFHLADKPARVGIDPMNVLIDRASDDNVVAPSERP